MRALGNETFHAVPLPGVMQGYIDEIRREARIIFEATQRRQYEEQKLLESAAMRTAALQQLEASQAKLAALWGEEWLMQHKRMMDVTNIEKEQN